MMMMKLKLQMTAEYKLAPIHGPLIPAQFYHLASFRHEVRQNLSENHLIDAVVDCHI